MATSFASVVYAVLETIIVCDPGVKDGHKA
jgi:hypothetical protein